MANNTATQTLAQAEGFQQTTLKVPVDVWRAVRIEALNRKVDAQDIWVEAVRKLLKLPKAA
jgi:hypothetical protein